MKKTKIYLSSLLFLLLLAVGCSSPEIEVNQENIAIIQKEHLETTELLDEFKEGNNVNAENSRSGITHYRIIGLVYNRQSAVFGVGHVGVAFRISYISNNIIRSQRWFYGAVENEGGNGFVRPGHHNGGWLSTSIDPNIMHTQFRNRGYNRFRELYGNRSVSAAECNSAITRLCNLPNRGYNITGNNCLNATDDVLNALSIPGMPWVSTNWSPNQWYNSLNSFFWIGSYNL